MKKITRNILLSSLAIVPVAGAATGGTLLYLNNQNLSHKLSNKNSENKKLIDSISSGALKERANESLSIGEQLQKQLDSEKEKTKQELEQLQASLSSVKHNNEVQQELLKDQEEKLVELKDSNNSLRTRIQNESKDIFGNQTELDSLNHQKNELEQKISEQERNINSLKEHYEELQKVEVDLENKIHENIERLKTITSEIQTLVDQYKTLSAQLINKANELTSQSQRITELTQIYSTGNNDNHDIALLQTQIKQKQDEIDALTSRLGTVGMTHEELISSVLVGDPLDTSWVSLIDNSLELQALIEAIDGGVTHVEGQDDAIRPWREIKLDTESLKNIISLFSALRTLINPQVQLIMQYEK